MFFEDFLLFFFRDHSTSRLTCYLTRLVKKAPLRNKSCRFLIVQFKIGSSSSGGLSHVTGSREGDLMQVPEVINELEMLQQAGNTKYSQPFSFLNKDFHLLSLLCRLKHFT